MTSQIGIILALFAVMTVLFFTAIMPLELTALVFLVLLTLLGYLTPDEAVSGFSSPTVITLIGMFYLSAAVKQTGLSTRLGAVIEHFSRRTERSLMAGVMLVTAAISAFMPNMSAATLMLPVTLRVAERNAISSSRLLMPMAFASVLGGMLTMVGSQPNIIAADLLHREGLAPFHFTSFTPFGLVAVFAGVLVMVTFGRRFLPSSVDQITSRAELAELYRLSERLISVRVPKGSSIHGRTLAELEFGGALGARVLSILRGGSRRQLPGARDVLQQNDMLVVGGRREDIEAMRRFNELVIEPLDVDEIESGGRGVFGAALKVADGGEIAGSTLRELHFHERYGALVLRVDRGGAAHFTGLAGITLAAGDLLYVLGEPAAIEAAAARPEFKLERGGIPLAELCRQEFFLIRLDAHAKLAGVSVRDSRLSEVFGVTIAGVRRDGKLIVPVPPSEVLKAGDALVVTGDPKRVRSMACLAELEILPEAERAALESADIAMVEVILSPRSDLVGRTLRDIGFRERYGMQVLALWREGRPRRSHLGDLQLSLGDALLLQVPREKLKQLQRDADFVVISEPTEPPENVGRAWIAVAGFVVLTLLTVLNIVRVDIAALAGAVFVALGGAVRVEQVYREIDWRIILTIAALLPFGIALEKCGAAAFITHQFLEGVAQPHLLLALLCIASSFFSQALDGSVAVIMLAPVGFRAAQQLHVSPYPFIMGIALGASLAFLSPISTRSNLLVMGAGGYRSRDYLVPGALVSLTLFVLVQIMIPWIYPF